MIKLTRIWGIIAIAAGIGVAVYAAFDVSTNNGEVVMCETNYIDGEPIGCKDAIKGKRCIAGVDKDGKGIYGWCTEWAQTYPRRGVWCPCW